MPAVQARAVRERARQNMPAAFGSVEHCGTPNNLAPAEWVLEEKTELSRATITRKGVVSGYRFECALLIDDSLFKAEHDADLNSGTPTNSAKCTS